VDIETYMREAKRFGNHREDVLWASLIHGLTAEAGEVMEACSAGNVGNELLSELGDVAWNIVRFTDVTATGVRWLTEPVEFERLPYLDPDRALSIACAKVSGLMEKWGRDRVAHWPTELEVANALGFAWQTLARAAEVYGWTMSDVMQANIDKLTARYAERGLPVKEAT
jgi:hypothetical protein